MAWTQRFWFSITALSGRIIRINQLKISLVMPLKQYKYLSKIGIIFTLSYCLITVVCLTICLGSDNNKGQYIFLQLPITLQMGVLSTLGLNKFLISLNWFSAYIIFWIPSVIFLYFMGWTLSQIVKALSKWKI